MFLHMSVYVGWGGCLLLVLGAGGICFLSRGCLLLVPGGCLPLVPGRGVSRPTPKGEVEGDLVQAHSQGEIEGDLVQAHSQREIEGDLVQAHSQGGKLTGSGPGPQPRGKLRGPKADTPLPLPPENLYNFK